MRRWKKEAHTRTQEPVLATRTTSSGPWMLTFGAGQEEDIKVEDRDGLPDFLAEGATLELVQLEQLLGPLHIIQNRGHHHHQVVVEMLR